MKVYSELINEVVDNYLFESSKESSGYSLKKYEGNYDLYKEMYSIKSERVSKIIGQKIGDYALVSLPDLLNREDYEISYYVNHISSVLKKFIFNEKSVESVLVVALGNRHFAADSFGDEVIKNIITTRLFDGLEEFENMPKSSAISASVFGLTGIESFDVVKGVVDQVKPDKIIAIDTLCASSYKRLGNSFQINNVGVVPGGGIGNTRKEISKKFLGVDVVSVGVPFVVYAHSLIDVAVDEMSRNKSNKLYSGDIANKIFTNIKKYNFDNLIVTPQNIEEMVKLSGKIVAYAINKSITNYSIAEQKKVLGHF